MNTNIVPQSAQAEQKSTSIYDFLWAKIGANDMSQAFSSIIQDTCHICKERIYWVKKEGLLQFLKADQQKRIAKYCPSCKAIWLMDTLQKFVKLIRTGYKRFDILYPSQVSSEVVEQVEGDLFAPVLPEKKPYVPVEIGVPPQNDERQIKLYLESIHKKVFTPLINACCLCGSELIEEKFKDFGNGLVRYYSKCECGTIISTEFGENVGVIKIGIEFGKKKVVKELHTFDTDPLYLSTHLELLNTLVSLGMVKFFSGEEPLPSSVPSLHVPLGSSPETSNQNAKGGELNEHTS